MKQQTIIILVNSFVCPFQILDLTLDIFMIIHITIINRKPHVLSNLLHVSDKLTVNNSITNLGHSITEF